MISKPHVWLAVLAIGLAALAACNPGAAGGLEVTGAWVRNSPMMDRAGAAYMVIENSGEAADRLVSVSSDVAATIELHETKDVGGMMEMSPVTGIDVPASGQVELKPGGLHVMLIGLTRELAPGDEVQLILNFEQAGAVQVTAEVREE
jgi:copper(I)-binding protein